MYIIHQQCFGRGCAPYKKFQIDHSPEQILNGREKLARIYEAIDRLPAKCRQAFLLHRNSGMSYADIARELDVSVSSVEKYILQALKQCRSALARYSSEGDKPPGK